MPLFGLVVPPVIEGFTFLPRADNWLCATDGQRHYIACQTNATWALFEIEYNKSYLARSNSSGLRLKSDCKGGLKKENADFLIDRSRFTEVAT